MMMMKKKTGARHFTPFSLCGIGFFHNWIIFTGNGLSWKRKYDSDFKEQNIIFILNKIFL